MIAYIDESGDQGTLGKGTRWLVFGAVMVADADVEAAREIAGSVSKLAGHGQRKEIHFTDMSHDDRHGCIDIFCHAPWVGSVIASDTADIRAGSALTRPRIQYNYAARYAVERISARAVELGEPATIYFEQRANFDLTEFRSYVQLLLDRGERRIDPRAIDPSRICQMPKRQDELLCVADALAFSAFRALELHRVWKRYERSYLEAFADKLWRGPSGQENIHLWGLVLRPTDQWGPVFTKEYPWLLDLPRT
jgi:hypothetical protein